MCVNGTTKQVNISQRFPIKEIKSIMKKITFNLLHASIIIGAICCSAFSAKAQTAKKPQLTGHYQFSPDAFDEKSQREKMKNDGLSQPVIDKLIAERKLFMNKMKNVHKAEQNVLKNSQGGVLPVPLSCSDLGVENGWSTWAGAPGVTNGTTGIPTLQAPVSPPVSASPQTCFTINTSGTDPCTPGTNPVNGSPGPVVPLVAPGFGGASIGIGCPMQVNCYAEQLTYSFIPTVQDTNLVYAYAVVIYDPGSSHGVTERPFCEFMILAPNGDTVPCSYQKYVAPGGAGPLPGFFDANASCTGGTMTSYKPWTVVGVNLSAYVGQNLTIKITNVDCSQCGHYAHSYWDFQCGPVPLAAGCVGNVSTITGPPSDPNNPYSYQWYNNGNVMSGQTNQTLIVTPQQGDTFSVHVGQPSGCDFYLTYVPAIAIPQFNYTGQCGNYVFTDSSYVTPAGSATITNWQWSFPGGNIVSGQGTPTATVTYPPGNHNATLTITSSAGCTATISHPLNVGGFPTAAVIPTTPCLGSTTSLSDGSVAVSGDPIANWSWQMPGGSPATAGSQNTSTIYSTSGTHTVTLIVTSQAGCKDTVTQQVIVYNPPIANFSMPDSGCAPVCVNYTDLSTSTDGTINNWQWSFPGGTPTGAGVQNPTNICYYTPGTYSVSLIVTTNYGCKDTIKLPMVKVYDWPTANFCVAPTVAPTTDPVFNFCDMWSNDVVAWSWNFGDNDSDFINTDPQHSYSATATENDFYYYNICIRVENQYGCWDTTCKTVELIPEFTFYIPNTFTPNGDFMNEWFYGKSRGVKEYNIWLFDRWGNQIWDCHKEDKNTNWDSDATVPKQEGLSSACKWDGVVVKGGVDMGGGSKQLAQEDVYVWKVRLTDIFDKKHMYIGHVNIVR